MITQAMSGPCAANSASTLAMAAGLATLELIAEPGFYARVGATTQRIVEGLQSAARDAGVPFSARAIGTMGGLYFRDRVPEDFTQACDQDLERYRRFYHAMLAGGVYFPPSHVEAFFVSSAHGDAEIDATLQAARRAFAA